MTTIQIWSYGVLLWELMTRGNVPYPTLEGYDVLRYLKAGNRMQKPETCPDQVYEIMLDCWQVNSKLRPPFSKIVERIKTIIKEKESEVNIYSNLNVNYVNYSVEQYYSQNARRLEELEKKTNNMYNGSISSNYYNSNLSLGPKSPVSPTALYSTPNSTNSLTGMIKMSTFKSNEQPISTFRRPDDLSPTGKVIEMPGKQQQVTLSAVDRSVNDESARLTSAGHLRGQPLDEEATPSHSRKNSNNSATLNRQNAIDLNEPDHRSYSTDARHYEYVMQTPQILIDRHKSSKELDDDQRIDGGDINLDQSNYVHPIKFK